MLIGSCQSGAAPGRTGSGAAGRAGRLRSGASNRLVALMLLAFGTGGAGIAASGIAASGLAPPAHAQGATAAPEIRKTEKPPGYRLGDLTVSRIWSHQSASRDGAAYLRIGNAGAEDDALIDASTSFAKRVELHGPVPGGEVWETGRVDAIPAPARQVVVLTGAALHLRLVGLRGALSVGGTVPITLTFERAGAITVQARVLSPNDAAAIIEKTMPQIAPGARPPAGGRQ